MGNKAERIMVRRSGRLDYPHDPASVMRTLRACRDVTMRLNAELKIGCPIDQAADRASEALAALADLIAGEKDYFLDPIGIGSTSPTPECVLRKLAMERGEIPWLRPPKEKGAKERRDVWR